MTGCRLELTFLEMLGGGMDHLEGDEFKATLLESGDDLSDKRALDSVGLGGSERKQGKPEGDWTLIMM
jgi:hypothetical protein